MQINDEVLWSTLTAVVAGIVLKTGDFIMNRSQNKKNRDEERIDEYHEAIQEELHSLREENRQLRAEADLYRKKYVELFELMYNKDPGLTPPGA